MEPMALATFLAFLFVLIFLGIAFYLKVHHKAVAFLDQRSVLIAKELDEARSLREEAVALLADYKLRTKNAAHEAEAIVRQARDDAERMRAEAAAALQDMIERRSKSAENKIAQAEAQAIADVRAAATDVAIAAAQEVLSNRIAQGLGAQLVDKSIADLKNHLN